MKELITAIRDQLREELTYIRSGDIFVTPHEDFLPRDVKFPCIGIKDGAINRADLMGGCTEYTMNAIIIPWVLIHKPEASIMGDEGTGMKGVLEIADDIHTALKDEFLGITGMQDVSSPSENGSETRSIENAVYQKKEITYRYVKEG